MAKLQYEIHKLNKDAPLFLWGMFYHRGDEATHLMECIEELCPNLEYSLVSFQVEDWNGDFSPWKAENMDASFQTTFKGNGKNTLLGVKEILDEINETYFDTKNEANISSVYLIGYSLAGLFSLWSLFEDINAFDGIGSCSGSLWYPDFVSYVEARLADTEIVKQLQEKKVYLSVGGKEANTKDPLMSTILDCTKRIEKDLKNEGIKVNLEMNSGGHFADSGKRLAKAIYWLANT